MEQGTGSFAFCQKAKLWFASVKPSAATLIRVATIIRFPTLPTKKTPPKGEVFFGAGYGNRTRLHGLGSRCITDIRTLHSIGLIIAGIYGKFNPFLSTITSLFRNLDMVRLKDAVRYVILH